MFKHQNIFFSTSFGRVPVNQNLPFDIFINGARPGVRKNFVRIFPEDEYMSEEDRQRFLKKYKLAYITENHIGAYLKCITASTVLSDLEKTEVVKEAAIKYMEKLFEQYAFLRGESLDRVINSCEETVTNMIVILKNHDITSLQKLISQLSFHDIYTYDHSINVAMYCMVIYRTLNPKALKKELLVAGMSGLFHDIGKMKISMDINNNDDKWADAEVKMSQDHPKIGYDYLKDSDCTCELDIVADVIMQHHENYDGSGYPEGLQEKNIHILARVTALADTFDSLTTKRKRANQMSVENALELMRKMCGTKIDPKLFQILSECTLDQKKKSSYRFELAEEFDPCRPHRKLPLIRDPGSIKYNDGDFGRVIID